MLTSRRGETINIWWFAPHKVVDNVAVCPLAIITIV